ncbi:hypothetical protein G5B47_11645 [Paenibacillus sp. 7124]|uniref:Sporulation membrane protein YtrI C-terminal domain-containing protein n=1 Tax=Paenibacillus apii TaxID=1850370 RepID=A0A6M1PKW7_9BACL|nr:hypothetical protein [Paenibacillus apii]NGM83068.1 hypothetical protein [Paenibacillus apii]NJJ40209.1 hypothetical protein [Paenibacillus apii]
MRVPPFQQFRRFSKVSAIFVLGMIVGSAVYNAIFHMGFNALWLDNQDLRVQVEQYEKDILTLKKYKNSSTVIKEIKIRSESGGSRETANGLDPATVKEIILKMSGDLAPMRGRSVFDIDEDSKMARLLLSGKVYIVRDKEYAVRIRTMLVMEGVLQIWVEITPNNRG